MLRCLSTLRESVRRTSQAGGRHTKMPRNVSCEQNPPSITARKSNDSYDLRLRYDRTPRSRSPDASAYDIQKSSILV